MDKSYLTLTRKVNGKIREAQGNVKVGLNS